MCSEMSLDVVTPQPCRKLDTANWSGSTSSASRANNNNNNESHRDDSGTWRGTCLCHSELLLSRFACACMCEGPVLRMLVANKCCRFGFMDGRILCYSEAEVETSDLLQAPDRRNIDGYIAAGLKRLVGASAVGSGDDSIVSLHNYLIKCAPCDSCLPACLRSCMAPAFVNVLTRLLPQRFPSFLPCPSRNRKAKYQRPTRGKHTTPPRRASTYQ
jgi:hypothetical protein